MSLTVFCTLVFRVVAVSIKNAEVLEVNALLSSVGRALDCNGFLVSKCRRFDSASGDILFAP